LSKVNKKISKQVVVNYQENSYFNYGLLAVFFVFLVFFTTFKITGDDDVFWHLATGRYILQTAHVPSVDIFGFMTQGQVWMPFEWGWDVLTYSIYTFSGYAGISVLRTILIIAVFYIFYYILIKFKVSNTFSVFSLLVLAFGIIDRLTPRPHLMSYLFFGILLLIICQYRYFNRGNKKVLYFIPLIFLLWANMHMGIIAGGFMMLLFFVSEAISTFYPSNNPALKALTKNELIHLFVVLAVSALMMLANPNFLQTYVYAFEHTKMKMLETVNEWMSPFSSRYQDSFVSYIYKILLFVGILNVFYAIKKKDWFPALLYIGFAVYSVRAMRFTVDYVLITFVFTIVSVYCYLNLLKSIKVKEFLFRKPALKIGLGLFIVFLTLNIPSNKLYLQYLSYYRVTGVGINSDFIPTAMFDFIKANDIQNKGDRVFNHFGTGGFFVWNFEGKQNFIDSRNLNDDIFNKYQQILGKRQGFEQKLEEYGIDYVMYLAPDLVRDPKEMENTCISYFCKSPNWKLVFWDDKSFLWVKNVQKFKELIDKYEFKYLTPYNYAYNKPLLEKGISEEMPVLKMEIDRKLADDANGVVISSVLKIYGNKLK